MWNEWNGITYWGDKPDTQHYIKLAQIAIPIIRECAPEAKIVLGSYAGFSHGLAALTPEELAESEKTDDFLVAIQALAKDVDVIGFHPFYQCDYRCEDFLRYADNVEALKKYCWSKGFRGTEFMASEYNFGGTYPPTEDQGFWWGSINYTEMQKAKLVMQLSMKNIALGVESLFCTLWNSSYPMDLSLMRRTFASYPVIAMTPQAAYYAMRNLSTLTENLMPDRFSVSTQPSGEWLESFCMKREGEKVLAVWSNATLADDCEGIPVDFTIDIPASAVLAANPMTGEEFTLDFQCKDSKTVIHSVLVRDYPLLLRLMQ